MGGRQTLGRGRRDLPAGPPVSGTVMDAVIYPFTIGLVVFVVVALVAAFIEAG